MVEIKFQVFGSKDSKDIDVLVFMESLPPTETSKKLCVKYRNDIKEIYLKNNIILEREIDVNLGVLNNGVLESVFKGSYDEVNNSLLYTYNYHGILQLYPQQITSPLKRDVTLKMLRSSRIILSLLSRTIHRNKIKKALKSDFSTQIELLKNIDLSKITDFGNKNGSNEDIYKKLVFQMGQTLALSSGFDIYSKSSISGMFPSISKLMNRESLNFNDLNALELLKFRYANKMSDFFDRIGKMNEQYYFLEKNIG